MSYTPLPYAYQILPKFSFGIFLEIASRSKSRLMKDELIS